MKCILLPLAAICVIYHVSAQDYPDPEFSHEIYFLKKDARASAVRLEKSTVKMENKTKLGGLGGAETSFTLEGEKSSVIISPGSNLSFIYSTGAGGAQNTAERDSTMRANGLDPTMAGRSINTYMSDPTNTISLYKAQSGNGKRKIMVQKIPGASPFGIKKPSSSDKFTFAVKQVRDGYWVLVPDKNLSAGEYAFSVALMGMGAMTGETTFFSFEIK